MRPNAKDPGPQAEKQNHRVTCRRGTGKDVSTQGIEGLDKDAS